MRRVGIEPDHSLLIGQVLTRAATWAEVAELLGVTVATVNKAVSRHRGVSRPR